MRKTIKGLNTRQSEKISEYQIILNRFRRENAFVGIHMPGIVESILQPQAAHTTTVQWAASFSAPRILQRRACKRTGWWSSHPVSVAQEGSPYLGLSPAASPLFSTQKRREDFFYNVIFLQWLVLNFREREGKTESLIDFLLPTPPLAGAIGKCWLHLLSHLDISSGTPVFSPFVTFHRASSGGVLTMYRAGMRALLYFSGNLRVCG